MPYDTDVLIDLVDRKRQILAQLCQQGLRQMDLIDRNELGELLSVLATKQQLILALQETERELGPFRDQQAQDRHWRTPNERTRCARLLSDCETLLAETLRQERVSETRLKHRRDEAALRLNQAHTAGQARQAYAPRHEPSLRQLDLSSEN